MPDACWPTSMRLAGELCLVHTQGGGLLPGHRVGEGVTCRVCRKELTGARAAAGKGASPRLPGVEGPTPWSPPRAGLTPPPPGAACAQLCPFFEMKSRTVCF